MEVAGAVVAAGVGAVCVSVAAARAAGTDVGSGEGDAITVEAVAIDTNGEGVGAATLEDCAAAVTAAVLVPDVVPAAEGGEGRESVMLPAPAPVAEELCGAPGAPGNAGSV